jgi:hypothetical protein
LDRFVKHLHQGLPGCIGIDTVRHGDRSCRTIL